MFTLAHAEYLEELEQGGFNQYNSANHVKEDEYMQDTSEALNRMANAASANGDSLTMLTNSIQTLTYTNAKLVTELNELKDKYEKLAARSL